ncbi:VOC family protein [Shewanella aestuarii]|uniref:VOC family protein n=1 Tax=Shewanella aestuarii TaxID=1028752 RepID=A0A6G9QFD5_9GAMM|nr:VOC family protein [Shewanella aestuarii]QIR13254.1 VOC family protein [Shewanella aestuarii]
MKVTGYQQGQPCWAELASTDWAAAKVFYQSLFNWQAIDLSIPDGHYTLLQIDNEDVAAMYQLSGAMGIDAPTHWTVYFAVNDVDDTIELIKQAGGQLIVGPHNVGDAGRMALFADPEGSRFAIWQAINHIGIKQAQIPNTLCWVELACRDTQQASEFYAKTLGLQPQKVDMSGIEYTEWHVAAQAVGGMMQMSAEWGDIPAHWMLYFAVEDCDATVTRAIDLGAKICVPPTDIAHVGRYAVINDPQGGIFSVIALAES